MRVEGIRGQNLRLRIIEVNRYGGRFHLGRRLGLHLPQPKMSPEEFGQVLRARDRRQAGMTAPPQGLFLVEVKY